MPTLPLPSGGAVIGGGDLPVSSEADVIAVFPSLFRTEDPAPVRDAIVSALTAIMLNYQDRSASAARQSSVLFATGNYLTECAAELGVFRQDGEDDESLRARAITAPSLVTPAAILAAANTILAQFTTKHAQYNEPAQDRMFLTRSTTSSPAFRTYAFRSGSTSWSPNYPSRLYPNYLFQNGGKVRPDSEVGAPRAFRDAGWRYFMLRVPDVSPIDSTLACIYSTASDPSFFIGTGASDNTTFLHSYAATSQSVYAQIISAIERVKGAGIRWSLLVDSSL